MLPNVTDNNYQFGFKGEHSTTLCSFILSQTVQYYNNSGSNAYVLFLDASKAFDRVKHDKLVECLLKKNICPLIVRIIFNMYTLSTVAVKWNGKPSTRFSFSNGVKQGGILSPYLFSIYLEPLIDELRDSGFGCHVGQRATNVLAYADDLALLAPTITSLKLLIKICEKFSKEFSLNFNESKSVLVGFTCNMNPNIHEINVQMNGQKIQVQNQEKYLGFNIRNKGNLYDLKKIITDMKVRTNTILNTFRCLDSTAKVNIFNAQCLYLYGCSLWNLEDPTIRNLETTWRKCSRLILNISPRTHNNLISDLMETPDIRTIIETRMINFAIKGIHHPNPLVSDLFLSGLINIKSSYFGKNLNIILRKHNINYLDIFTSNRVKIQNVMGNSSWKASLIKEIISLRDFKTYDFFNAR